MYEFENLKNSYIKAIQFGMICHASSGEAKHGNEILHKFCENIIDGSNYTESDKNKMKQELKAVKEMLSIEIEKFYKDSSS